VLDGFTDKKYHLRVYGPNGFYREFMGDAQNPKVEVLCRYETDKKFPKILSGNIIVTVNNLSAHAQSVLIADKSYKSGLRTMTVAANKKASLVMDLKKSHNWYDLEVTIDGNNTFSERFAGRVETGKITKTDPLMGRMV